MKIFKFIVLVILYINSKSLYYYIVKLDTYEKYLIIDMINFC